jgi:two-component system phosphate regulon sensor histidine kinase PhoR
LSTLLDGAMNDKTIRKLTLETEKESKDWFVQDLDMISKLEIGDLNLEIAEFDIVKLVQNVLIC